MSLRSASPQAAAARAKLKTGRAAGVLCALLGAVLLVGTGAPAQADCMRDRKGQVVCDRGRCASDSHGRVYCSAYEDGAAVRDRHGEVVCAKGSCVVTIKGDIICSARPGGAAMLDYRGEVTCEAACERASVDLCGQGSSGRR